MNLKNPDLLKKLEKSGLSDKEALIYLSLLELGGAYPSKIAEYSGLNRSTVYMVLLNLSVRGLVNEIEKKNKLFYQIENPNRLIKYTKSKLSIIENEIEQAEKILPEIEGLFTAMGYKPKVTYFEGLEGVLQVYESHINVSKPYEMLAWSNASGLEELLPEKFFVNYRRTKEKKGITTRGIIPNKQSDLTFTDRTYENFKKEIVPVMRFIPSEKFPFKAEVTVYDQNKVSIVNLSKEKLTGVIIEDETIHGLMKMIFELSWIGAKK